MSFSQPYIRTTVSRNDAQWSSGFAR